MTEITDGNRRDLGPQEGGPRSYPAPGAWLCPPSLPLSYQSYVDGPQGAPATNTAAKKLAMDEQQASQTRPGTHDSSGPPHPVVLTVLHYDDRRLDSIQKKKDRRLEVEGIY